MNLLIIGAGLSGAVIANKAARAGKKVLILEKRHHVAGNVFDIKENGITKQVYGPHIFHTNSNKIKKYMEEFWELNDFKNVVEGEVKNKIIPIPFNFKGIDEFWPNEAKKTKEKLISKYGVGNRVSILELLEQKDIFVKGVAQFIYDNVFLNYTTKMWGKKPDEIDKSVMKRVPVVVGYNDRYFSDKYEGVPKDGYTNTIKKMLNHENIEVRLGQDGSKMLNKKDGKIFFEGKEVICPIVYGGPVDEFFQYEHGILDYRSLNIVFEDIKVEKYQNTAVVNYPNHPTMTRITEFKNLTLEIEDGHTIISKEYPGKYVKGDSKFGVPFYPNPTEESREVYNKYKNMISRFKDFYLIGRMATYKYLNMDQAIEAALELADRILR